MPYYLRKEPPAVTWYEPPPTARSSDVAAYADAEATELLKRWKWNASDRPRSNIRYLLLGTMEKYVVWLPDSLNE